MVRQETSGAWRQSSVAAHEHRAQQMAGDPARGRRRVALHTLHIGHEPERRLRGVGQRVEDGAAPGIDGRDLEHATVRHEPDIDIVIEIDRAWGTGRDVLVLEARFREHQDLRGNRDVQLAEQGRQRPLPVVERERRLAGRDTLRESCHRVVQAG